MINCNPETVSTDYDTSDRLYFEPLTLEDVLGVLEVERPEGVIVQFGGQTPLKLAAGLARGRRARCSARASTRSTWPRTAGASARCWTGWATRRRPTPRRARCDEALAAAESVGFPLLVRPSYVLGGRAMEIVYSRDGPGRLPRARRSDERPRDLPRPLPRERDRGRRRRALRRRGRLDRRDHAARRGGRHPLRRLRLRAAAALARPRDARPDPRADARASRWGSASSACSTSSSPSTTAASTSSRPTRARRGPCRSSPRRSACRWPRWPAGSCSASAWPTSTCPADPMARRPRRASRRRCCPSTASRAPTRCSARRCARPARSWASRATSRRRSPRPRPRPARRCPTHGTAFITVTDSDKAGAVGGGPVAARPRLPDRRDARDRARRSSAWASRRSELNKIGEGSPNVVDWIERGDVDLVVNTPTGSGARTDGWEIRRAAVARGHPLPDDALGRRWPRRGRSPARARGAAGGAVAAGGPPRARRGAEPAEAAP